MDFLYFYGLFALTTAVVAVYELYWPVLSQLMVTHPELSVVQYWKIALVTLFFGSLFLAPVLFFVCIIPSKGERFRTALTLGLEKSN
jgi:hypothetical protein